MGTMKWSVCAAGLMALGLAGCESSQLTGFFAMQNNANGHERVVTASVDTVAQSARATLSDLGMVATITKQGDSVRVASKTARGTQFTLVLQRDVVNGQEQTRARIEWADGREDPIGGQILAALDVTTKR